MHFFRFLFIIFIVSIHPSPILLYSDVQASSSNLFPSTNLHLYKDHDPLDIRNDSALAEIAEEGSGVNSDPFIIEGWKLSGIYIIDTTKYFIIRGCIVEENGIILRNISGSPKIAENFITSINNVPYQYANDYRNTAEDAAIFLSYCTTALIQNNTCNGEICLEYCPSPTLTDNMCSTGGIYLNFCESPLIISNTISDSDFDGIHINHCADSHIEENSCVGGNRYGLALFYSNSTILTNNTFAEYLQHGICFSGGTLQEQVSHCAVSRNILRKNSQYGIKIDFSSSNNTFHHNSFLENGLIPQAYDSDSNQNEWYDTTTNEGNYWSDHSACDPYVLAGNDGVVSDSFPLDVNLILKCDRTIILDTSAFFLVGIVSLLMIALHGLKKKKIRIYESNSSSEI